MKTKFSLLIVCGIFLNLQAQKKVLFDATKAEMAGNADWVIDADLHNLKTGTTVTTGGTQSNPQRVPTPAQSNITATTSETYWNGALSYWAIDLARQGMTIESLPYNAKITYQDASNPQDLSNYDVYIVDEPNMPFSMTEKQAIINFVKNGGGLYIIADHDISDRNNDGWDSPMVWNDLFTNNGVVSNPFGFSFSKTNVSQTSTNFVATSTNPLILNGPMGKPTAMQFSNGSTMQINKTANPSVQPLIFTNNTSQTSTTNVMLLTSTYGTGKIVALGDSSVPDDGTGDSGDSLYNGYTDDANGNHRPLLVNSVLWLAQKGDLGTLDNNINSVKIYPNPTKDYITISKKDYNRFEVIDQTGGLVSNGDIIEFRIDVQKLNSGIYYLVLKSDTKSETIRFIKN
ncbi:Por secretion system C-terminal sorting domain-containing protein [Soonwooa buanensis]|uniref:Por secretion system C-terminal sorting domain-containing protein n=1 Tax=Soonwooa buanensis TaxID=619805 RepID=A0A1T5EE24_9FLAO|nr:T9SS type A sorting domain-containing protein [Soonwooa buanensis]SKB82196.1 Por secretion system C-terminal sorting domain-containing protein [Soonwooa buanensis]